MVAGDRCLTLILCSGLEGFVIAQIFLLSIAVDVMAQYVGSWREFDYDVLFVRIQHGFGFINDLMLCLSPHPEYLRREYFFLQ